MRKKVTRRIQQEPQSKDINELLASENEASKHTRHVYFTFVALATYVAISIGSTTDVQLLRIDPVTLPLLNVGISIVGFYAIIPWLITLLHFNLLLQIFLYSRTLHSLNRALANAPNESLTKKAQVQISTFYISRLIVGGNLNFLMRRFISAYAWVTLILLPLVLLLWAQVRFLPYHEASITWGQRFAILADVMLLWSIWPLIMDPEGRLSFWNKNIAGSILRCLAWPFLAGPRKSQATPSWRGKVFRVTNVLSFISQATLASGVLVFSIFVATIPGEGIELWVAKFAPSNWVIPRDKSRSAHNHGLPSRLYLTDYLFDRGGSIFHRNLIVRNKILINGSMNGEVLSALQFPSGDSSSRALGEITGIGLEGRDLRFADFSRSSLPNADLRNADLRGVNFSEARLQGASLVKANLQYAKLADVKLQAADFSRADFKMAAIYKANLAGANLQDANFEGADISYSWLKDATLTAYRFSGASIVGLDLSGVKIDRPADFSYALIKDSSFKLVNFGLANFRGADITEVAFQGAALNGAILDGAHLEYANFRGASLVKASLRGAHFRDVDFQGGNLSGANFDGAEFESAEFWGANMQRAILTNVDLSNVNFRLNDFRGIRCELRAETGETTQDKEANLKKCQAILSKTDSLLCDKSNLSDSCATPSDIKAFKKKLSQFLVGLSIDGHGR